MSKHDSTLHDAEISHAMITAVLAGIILTLKQHGISPWDLTETLSRFTPKSPKEALGLELAQEWVYRQFTERTPPPEASEISHPTPPEAE